jgi:hypothetical protein
MDYATNESARQVVGLVSAMAKLGRITAAPPGTPPNRLADLRAAYHAALDDPDLLADAARSRRPIEPAFGEDVARLVTEALDQTPETIAIVTDALAPEWEHAGAETSYRLALAN